MSRVWAVGDPICEHRDQRWRIGTVAHVDKWAVTIRWAGAEHLVYRSPSDTALVDPDTVPIDARHWVPAKVRDQLVRQEAARRLRAMWDALPLDSFASPLSVADDLDALLDPCADRYAAAARALLAPAPQPATTEATR
jgi:hypothetical protein